MEQIKEIKIPKLRVVGEGLYLCVICGDLWEGFGNNAEPLKNGLCCDTCNYSKVLQARYDRKMGYDKK